jgi:hypothetical protein
MKVITAFGILSAAWFSISPQASRWQALELCKILSGAGVQHSVGVMEPNFFPGENFALVVGVRE